MLGALGCHAQSATPAKPVPAAGVNRRIEVLVRNTFQVPADVYVQISPPSKSSFNGYDDMTVTFFQNGKASKPVPFLLSEDGTKLLRMTTYDISKDPKDLVSGAGRPSRGQANAPVQIVVFDDLECPFCARMHSELFPAAMERYKDQLHISYKDYPLVEIHPWAMHAAIDTNCLASQSMPGYWNLVDYMHANASDISGPDHNVEKADALLDQLTKDEGQKQKVNAAPLSACIAKQDDTQIRGFMKEGDALGVNATPILWVNGERVEGAVPAPELWKVIDRALLEAGITPPPPAPDTPATTPAAAPTTPPAATPPAPAKPSGS